MSEETAPATTGANAVTVDDGTMQDIADKLKLLHYETDFCPIVKPPFKPLNRYYFSGASTIDNPNAQFYYFTSLTTWLMGICGHNVDAPGQFDDPNATATTILAELRSMGLQLPGLAPNRLKQGSGEAVLTVLATLVDAALAKKGIEIRPIDYKYVPKYDETADVAEGDDEADDVDVEDNVIVDSDDEDEVYVRATGEKQAKESDVPVSSTINAEEWNLEVERIAPLLQVRTTVTDDWRSRIESASVLLKAVEKMYPDVKQMLGRLADDMDKSSDRIRKREQTLAQQFSEQVEQYRVKLKEMNTSKDAANVASQSVQQLTMELNQVSEVLDQTKHDIEDREAKISDTTPLMQVKEAVTKVQAEINQMALRIGVLQHGVLHYIMKQTKASRQVPGAEEDDFMNGYEQNYY